jgi:hypothetical protein
MSFNVESCGQCFCFPLLRTGTGEIQRWKGNMDWSPVHCKPERTGAQNTVNLKGNMDYSPIHCELESKCGL